MQCVIIAGGLATRMRPLTESTPKSLLEVAGRPFIEHQLEWLVKAGVTDIVLCVGFLGERIEQHVGDGSEFGASVGYAHEGDELMGTGGALRLALEQDLLAERFLVTYGDSYLPVDPASVLAAFDRQQLPALMCVFRNEGRFDTSNVQLEGETVKRYDKQAAAAGEPGFDHIDYGLLAFERPLIEQRIPKNTQVDLASVLTGLAAEGSLAALPVTQRFYEIGSRSGLEELNELLAES